MHQRLLFASHKTDVVMLVVGDYTYIMMKVTSAITDQNPWWADPAARASRWSHVRKEPHRRLMAHAVVDSTPMAAVMIGPRQVGKTTLLRQVVDSLLAGGWPARSVAYIDLSDDRLLLDGGLRESLLSVPRTGKRVLLIDELQVIQNWSQTLKTLIDHASDLGPVRPDDRIIATGSAATALHSGYIESGPGRWTELGIEGLEFLEFVLLQTGIEAEGETALLRSPQLLPRYLLYGGYPGWISAPPAEARRLLREAVSERTVARDLVGTGIDLVGARRLLAYLAWNAGAEFSPSKVGEAIGPAGHAYDYRTVNEWRAALESTHLFVPLPRHTMSPGASLRSKDKLYPVDHALVGAFAPVVDPIADGNTFGRIVETLIFRQLRGLLERVGLAAPADGRNLGYVRAVGREVDFAFVGHSGPVLVEVTSSDGAQGKIKDVSAVAQSIGAIRANVIHTGTHQDEIDGVSVIPLHRFLLDPTVVLGGP